MDLIQHTNKEFLLEILTIINIIKRDIEDIKITLKDNEEKSPRHLPEIEDKINGWFWSG